MLMKEFIYDKSAKVSILLLIIMVIIYTLGSLYFKSHFFFRTSIDGIDISCKTMDEAKNEVYGNVKDYKLKIKDKSGFIDVIVSDDINLYKNKPRNLSLILKFLGSFSYIIIGIVHLIQEYTHL